MRKIIKKTGIAVINLTWVIALPGAPILVSARSGGGGTCQTLDRDARPIFRVSNVTKFYFWSCQMFLSSFWVSTSFHHFWKWSKSGSLKFCINNISLIIRHVSKALWIKREMTAQMTHWGGGGGGGRGEGIFGNSILGFKILSHSIFGIFHICSPTEYPCQKVFAPPRSVQDASVQLPYYSKTIHLFLCHWMMVGQGGRVKGSRFNVLLESEYLELCNLSLDIYHLQPK